MQSFSQFLNECGVDNGENLINFLENLSEDNEQTPSPEIEDQIHKVFETIFN
jgi:hypothetical protein